jgi:hypothetical protein
MQYWQNVLNPVSALPVAPPAKACGGQVAKGLANTKIIKKRIEDWLRRALRQSEIGSSSLAARIFNQKNELVINGIPNFILFIKMSGKIVVVFLTFFIALFLWITSCL